MCKWICQISAKGSDNQLEQRVRSAKLEHHHHHHHHDYHCHYKQIQELVMVARYTLSHYQAVKQ